MTERELFSEYVQTTSEPWMQYSSVCWDIWQAARAPLLLEIERLKESNSELQAHMNELCNPSNELTVCWLTVSLA